MLFPAGRLFRWPVLPHPDRPDNNFHEHGGTSRYSVSFRLSWDGITEPACGLIIS